MKEIGKQKFIVPKRFYPVDMIYIRLRAEGLGTRFQIFGYTYEATIPKNIPEFDGHTKYVDILQQNEQFAVKFESIKSSKIKNDNEAVFQVTNKTSSRQIYELLMGEKSNISPRTFTIEPRQSRKIILPIKKTIPLVAERKILVRLKGKKQSAFIAQLDDKTPYILSADYGNLIGDFQGIQLWWTDGAQKVGKLRPVPTTAKKTAIEFFAAKNEYEPMQLVIKPNRNLNNVKVTATNLQNSKGAKILAQHIHIMLVEYVPIQNPTDAVGTVGLWPDPLPPVKRPFSIRKGENQPLWISIYVPSDVSAGDYTGELHLRAGEWEKAIPIRLRVWNFTLPQKNHLQSSFGFSASLVKKYHHLTTSKSINTVLEKYYKNFADHRISPYNPFKSNDIREIVDKNAQTVKLKFNGFDQSAKRYFDGYGFTSYRMKINGLPSGTYKIRREGNFAGYKQGSSQYKKMMSSYLIQLQCHFDQKGWLDEAYIYWFDEPEEKDYSYVKDIMSMIHQAAPKLTRMITEQPTPSLYGYVDLWCPKSSLYDHQIAEQRRKKGDRFWWYLSTSPREPYCTLFIDHYAVELRTWIWQTWKYNIEGILIWETNYWSNSAESPTSELQNPYRDPMSYSTPTATKKPDDIQYWGNGDGRFLYPPLSVFNSNIQCLEDPVNSIRWELLREGLEDYEYLWLLRSLIKKKKGSTKKSALLKQAEALLQVPEDITSTLTEFSKKPDAIFIHRMKLAKMIERLTSGLKQNSKKHKK